MTRSLPCRTWSGSRLSRLAVVMKRGHQPARGIADREVALVALQRGDQHFFRQAQEFGIETAR